MSDFVNENDQCEADHQRQRRFGRVRRDAQGHRGAGDRELRQAESFKWIHRQTAHVVDGDEKNRLDHADCNHQTRKKAREDPAFAMSFRRCGHAFHRTERWSERS